MPISLGTDDNRFRAKRYLYHPHFIAGNRLTMTGVNATVNFLLAAIAVIEIWQFFFQVLRQNPGVSFWCQFRDISGCTKVRRTLQIVAISGLLLLAGAASIVKAYVSYPMTGFVRAWLMIV